MNHFLKLMSLLFHFIGPCGSILQWTSPISGIVIGVCWLQYDLPKSGRRRIFSQWPSTSSDCRRTFTAAKHASWGICHMWGCCRIFDALYLVAKGKCFVFSSPMTLFCVFCLYIWPCWLDIPHIAASHLFFSSFNVGVHPSLPSSLHFCSNLNPQTK